MSDRKPWEELLAIFDRAIDYEGGAEDCGHISGVACRGCASDVGNHFLARAEAAEAERDHFRRALRKACQWYVWGECTGRRAVLPADCDGTGRCDHNSRLDCVVAAALAATEEVPT